MLKREPAPLAEGDPLPPDDLAPSAADAMVSEIYRREQPRLLKQVRRQSPGDHAADVVQQVFVRFLGLGRARRSAIASPAAYLRQAAAHLSIDEARTAARRHVASHLPDDAVDLRAPDQIAALEARDMLNRLEATLQRLTPRTREIFLAHRFDGYSYVEIAAKTGLSVKGVEKHMSKAIAHIDRVLGDR